MVLHDGTIRSTLNVLSMQCGLISLMRWVHKVLNSGMERSQGSCCARDKSISSKPFHPLNTTQSSVPVVLLLVRNGSCRISFLAISCSDEAAWYRFIQSVCAYPSSHSRAGGQNPSVPCSIAPQHIRRTGAGLWWWSDDSGHSKGNRANGFDRFD